MSELSATGKTPAIRFKGFGGEWEEVLLSHATDIYDGTHQTPRYTNKGVMFLSVENIQSLTSEKYISKEDFEKDFKVYPMKNDVLMTRIGDVGTANVVTTDNPIAYYVTLALLKYKGVNPYFLKNSLSSNSVKKEIWHRTLHIAFPKKINMNEIAKVVLNVPKNQKEQTQIGNFFQQLDRLISQHQQKHDKLRCVKKALLEKMFPKQGETQPAIRFKGFSEAWEEKALGEVMSLINGRAYSQEELLSQGRYKVLRVGNFYTNSSWYYSDMELGEKYYADSGDLLYTWSASFGPHIWQEGKVIYHYHIWKLVLSEEIDKLFALHTLDYDKEKILSDKNGSTMVHITKEGMEKKSISIPSKKEQTQIGNLFQQLDTLINQQQSQLSKLGNIKQALLAKMFV